MADVGVRLLLTEEGSFSLVEWHLDVLGHSFRLTWCSGFADSFMVNRNDVASSWKDFGGFSLSCSNSEMQAEWDTLP